MVFAGTLRVKRSGRLPGPPRPVVPLVHRGNHERTDGRPEEAASRHIEPIAGEQTEQKAADERSADARKERERPVDSRAAVPEDHLGQAAGQHADSEDREDEHGRTVARR